MQVKQEGICPKQEKSYSISVEYQDVSSFAGRQYVRGLADCEYRNRHGCKVAHCPILNNAPKTI